MKPTPSSPNSSPEVFGGSVATVSYISMRSRFFEVAQLCSQTARLEMVGSTKLLLSDHVSDFNTSQCDRSGLEGHDAKSWPRDLLDETMILLDDVNQVFHARNFNWPMGSRRFQAKGYMLQPG